jgi:hypothetical protein
MLLALAYFFIDLRDRITKAEAVSTNRDRSVAKVEAQLEKEVGRIEKSGADRIAEMKAQYVSDVARIETALRDLQHDSSKILDKVSAGYASRSLYPTSSASQIGGKFSYLSSDKERILIISESARARFESIVPVAQDIRVQVDGKRAKLEDLKQGMLVRVTLNEDQTATEIEASSPVPASPP